MADYYLCLYAGNYYVPSTIAYGFRDVVRGKDDVGMVRHRPRQDKGQDASGLSGGCTSEVGVLYEQARPVSNEEFDAHEEAWARLAGYASRVEWSAATRGVQNQPTNFTGRE